MENLGSDVTFVRFQCQKTTEKKYFVRRQTTKLLIFIKKCLTSSAKFQTETKIIYYR